MLDAKHICASVCGAKCCRQQMDVHLSSDEAVRLTEIAKRKGLAFEPKRSMVSHDHFYMELERPSPVPSWKERSVASGKSGRTPASPIH